METDFVATIIDENTAWGEERPVRFRDQTTEIRRHGGVVGYTYTELYDIEHELAGLARYDRSAKEVGYDLTMINSADFVGLDYHGNIIVKPGTSLEVPVFISAYGQPALTTAVVDWRLERIADEPETLLQGSYGTLEPTPYSVTELAPLALTLPEGRGSVRLWVEVWDSDGTLRAHSTLDLGIF